MIGFGSIARLLHDALTLCFRIGLRMPRIPGTTFTFQSGDARLRVARMGAGTPVILVHGIAAGIAPQWVAPRLMQRLAKHHTVYALDMRGHGASDKPCDPECYGVEMARDIVRLMDHERIERAHVVGYSMGGFVVSKLATMHPERLLSVTACACGWSARPEEEFEFARTLAEDLDCRRGWARLFQRLRHPGREMSPLRCLVTSACISSFNDLPAMSAILRAMPSLYADESELRANTVPALILIGEQDGFLAMAEEMAVTMNRARLRVIPRGEHVTLMWLPEYYEALSEFLECHETAAVQRREPRPAPDGLAARGGRFAPAGATTQDATA